MTSVGYEEIKALVRMTASSDPFVASVAKATLSVVEGLRDAEIRAATAEAALATERARVEDMKLALARFVEAERVSPAGAHIDALRSIVDLV
jgi:hypothetical protein